MTITASAIMWAGGIAFSVIGGLVMLVWAMLNKRLNNLEEQAKTDRKEFHDTLTEDRKVYRNTLNDIFGELKADRERANDNHTKILEAIHEASADYDKRYTGCIEKFATKKELNDGLNAVREEVRKSA